jgi:CubicO group peptidase (beta-lactamase class C family)
VRDISAHAIGETGLRARRLMIMALLFATALMLALVGCSSRSISKSVTDEVDELFAKWNTPGSPGCGVGISRNGTVIYERGYGMANLDHGVAITPATVFDAASISKQFTAMSILLLAGRRHLSLDDDVAKYIPNWGERAHRITIRHLLTHTSGLRDGFLLQGLAPGHAEGMNQQIVNILARARGFNFVPGAEFEYNNSAYTLLAGIVERVSRQSLRAFAESNIFEPLGMTHTHFHDDVGRIVPNRATGYSRAPNGFRVAVRTYTDNVVGNAGLFTTVGDLLRWKQNLADVRVGDPALIAEMQTPAIKTNWSDTSGYGFRRRDRPAPGLAHDWTRRRRRGSSHLRRALSRPGARRCRTLQPRRYRPCHGLARDRRLVFGQCISGTCPSTNHGRVDAGCSRLSVT